MNSDYQLAVATTVPDARRKMWRPLYHIKTIAIGAIGTEVSFFNQGQDGTVGWEDTNMPQANQLNAGEAFDMYSLCIYICAQNQVDAYGIAKNYAVEMKFGGRDKYFIAPLIYWLSGMGPSGQGATGSTTALLNWTNGFPSSTAIRMFPPELVGRLPERGIYGVLRSKNGYSVTAEARIGFFLEGVYYDSYQ